MSNKASAPKDLIKLCVGSLLLVIGIAMVLKWWPDVVALFRGVGGMALALAGMIVLYTFKK